MPLTTALAFPPFSNPYPPGILRTLAHTNASVAAALEITDQKLVELGQPPVTRRLTADAPGPAPSAETEYVHNLVAATLVPYSVYASLDLKRQPAILLGHGAGFNVGSVITDLMSMAETIDVLLGGYLEATRLSLRGGMLAVGANQQTARAMCRQISEDGLHVGMINTPTQTVVCGRFHELDLLERHAERRGIPCRRLAAILPIHTPLFKPAALQAILRQEERTVQPVLPPLYFTTECRPIIETDTVRKTSLAIWTKPANLIESVTDLQENFGVNHFIEVNTAPTLAPMIVQNACPGTRVDGPPPGITDAADVLPFHNDAY
jgi:malonyl CoA-acyl carrier protein transacylase